MLFRELFSSDLPYYILDKIQTTEEDFLSEIQHNVVNFTNYKGDIELSVDPPCVLHLEIKDEQVICAMLDLVGEANCDVTEDLNSVFFSGYNTRQSLTEEDFLDPDDPEFSNRALKSKVRTLLESGNLTKKFNV